MNKIHQKRIIYVFLFCFSLATGVSLILYALKQNINVFVTPSQIPTTHLTSDYQLRLGGMVKEGSVMRDKTGLGVHFVVTDFKKEIRVNFVGVLPDLFREGKGAIVEGYLTDKNQLNATQVLAKHDENYMPKNVYRAMRENFDNK